MKLKIASLLVFSALITQACAHKNIVEPIPPTIKCSSYGPDGMCRFELGVEMAVYGVLVDDVDLDGYLDILSHGHDWKDVVYFGGESGFRRSGLIFGPDDRHFCDAADYNLDGVIDFYCAMGSNKGEGEGLNVIYEGPVSRKLGRQFLPKRANHGAEDPTGRGRRVLFFNFDDDLYPDLFVSNLGERSDGSALSAVVFKNEGGEKFSRLPSAGVGQSGLTCLDKLDWDRDGRDEVLACSKFKRKTQLFKNTLDGLIDVTDKLPVKSGKLEVIDGKFIDFDNDGNDDLALLDRKQGLLMFKNSGDPKMPFTVLGAQILPEQILENWAGHETEIRRGRLAFDSFDANGDGAQDIYVGIGIEDQLDPQRFLGDKIFYGPDFQSSYTFEFKSTGTHEVENFDETGIVISQAGQNWEGLVFLLTRESVPQE